MSRLIDADKLIHALANDFCNGKKTLGQVIDEQPTAFDVDKVIEQIGSIKEKEYRACSDQECGYCNYFNTCFYGDNADKLALDKAIEIVKGGGIE